MAAGSDQIRDILITYNIVGDDKLRALGALSEKAKLAVVADSLFVIEGLSAAFARRDRRPSTPWRAGAPCRCQAEAYCSNRQSRI